jgi:hypothetical protein
LPCPASAGDTINGEKAKAAIAKINISFFIDWQRIMVPTRNVRWWLA